MTLKGKKLLWISDGLNMKTGYGIQSASILKELAKHFGTTYMFSFQYRGDPVVLNGVTMLSCGYDMWGNDILKQHIDNLKPDYIVTLLDLFRPCVWLKDQAKNLKQHGAKTIAYFPIDGDPLPFDTLDPINVWEQFDHLIPMSHYGKKVLLRELPHLKDKVTEPIWHGIDTNIFKPLKKENTAFYKKNPVLHGKFVITSVFRNIIRKNPQALVFAFGKFAKGKDDVLLVCHTNPNEPQPQGTNMGKVIVRLGLDKKVMFTGSTMLFFAPPSDFVNEVINAGDVNVLATTGEGFGIPTIESMSAGKPNIITDYTTSEELISSGKHKQIDNLKFVQRGCLIDKFFMPPTCYQLTNRGFIKHKELAEAFEWYYQTWKNDKKQIKAMYEKKCRQFAVENFDWTKAVLPQWVKFFEGIQ